MPTIASTAPQDGKTVPFLFSLAIDPCDVHLDIFVPLRNAGEDGGHLQFGRKKKAGLIYLAVLRSKKRAVIEPSLLLDRKCLFIQLPHERLLNPDKRRIEEKNG